MSIIYTTMSSIANESAGCAPVEPCEVRDRMFLLAVENGENME